MDKLVTSSSLSFRAADGVPLNGAVTRPSGAEGGVVVLAHGITVDLHEGGMFARLAEALAAEGLVVLRFSFRGHGGSGGDSRGVTVAGEMLDLRAALEAAGRYAPDPPGLVAASFAAVPVALSLRFTQLRAVAWWNPVLDVRSTFLEPDLPWGRENFGPEQQRLLAEQGVLTVDGQFELGPVLFAEFECLGRAPFSAMTASGVPALVVHGDRDTAVSYDLARAAARAHPCASFYTVAGADHGFDGRAGAEDEAISVTAAWMADQFGSGQFNRRDASRGQP